MILTSKDIDTYGLEVDNSSRLFAEVTKQNIVGEGTVKAHVVYQITTTIPEGQPSVVQRRYSDFEWLQRSLEEKHKDLLIPPIPEKDALARFHTSVLQYRKREFNRFLARIIAHPVLVKDSSVDVFLNGKEEELAEAQAADSTLQQVGKAAQGFSFSSVFESVKKVGEHLINQVDEVDEYYTTQQDYLEGLDQGLTQVKKTSAMGLATKQEKVETSLVVGDKLALLVDLEKDHDKKMSKYLSLYQEFLSQKTVLDETLIKNQTCFFEDAVLDQQRLSVASKRLLSNRLEVLLNYQIATQNLNKVNASASTEKLALEKQEAEEKEQKEKESYENISEKAKEQIEDYKTEKSKLMRWALRELVRENIEHGEQLISSWKELGSMVESVK